MIPAELEKLVIKHKEEGHLPFFVNCTTGTTVYGAYDPISEIAGNVQLSDQFEARKTSLNNVRNNLQIASLVLYYTL